MEMIVYSFQNQAWVPVGRLRSYGTGNDAGCYFAYGKEYLKRADAISIDPISLPLSERTYQTEVGFKTFNIIRDAGPDNWGRYLIGKHFNRSLSELEYISALGEDRVGALAFGPDLNGPKLLIPDREIKFDEYKTKNFDLEYALRSTERVIADQDLEELHEFLKYGPSLGGARPKIALKYNNEDYLAKFSISLDQRPEPVIEYASMRLAALAGLHVPEILLRHVLKRDVFLIKRFDRKISESAHIEKIHFMSALTACNLHQADYKDWSYQAICTAISKLSDQPERDKLELYKRMVLNILLNNDDDHMRNHGFIRSSQNSWRLSPLYDVVPRDQLTGTFRLALNIGDYAKEASKRNAVSAAPYFGLEESEAIQIWEEISTVIQEKWRKVFKDAGMSSTVMKRFEQSIGEK